MNRQVSIVIVLSIAVIAAIVAAAGAVLFSRGAGEGDTLPNNRVAGDAAAQTTARAPWPIFRGNSAFQGIASGELPDELQLAWTFSTGGPVKSSAVVGDGVVYFGSDDYHVYAVDLASGTERWKFKTEGPVEAAPLLVGDTLYIGSSDGILYALDAATGAKRWTFETGDKIIGSANAHRAGGDAGNGPLRIIFGSYDFVLYCVDAATGEEVWQYETGDYINGAPAIERGRVVFGGCDMRLHIVSADTGEKLGEMDLGAQIAATVALDGDHAFIGHYGNAFECIDLNTQTNVWTTRDRQFPIFSSAAVLEDVVIFGTRGKRVICADRATGEHRWEFRTRGKVDSSPVVCGDKVVVGAEDGRLYLLDRATGQERWMYDVGKAITASPAVADGCIIIGSEDGNVYAFRG